MVTRDKTTATVTERRYLCEQLPYLCALLLGICVIICSTAQASAQTSSSGVGSQQDLKGDRPEDEEPSASASEPTRTEEPERAATTKPKPADDNHTPASKLPSTANRAPSTTCDDPGGCPENLHPTQIEWKWARFSPWEYAITGTTAAGYLAIALAVPTPSTSYWGGPILFDKAADEAFVFKSRAGRRSASLASDILLGSLVGYSILDAFGLSWAITENFDVATQLLLLDLQSFAVTSLLTESTKHLVRRERSSNLHCHETNTNEEQCDKGTPHESFFSGHASMAFTAAGLICATHIYIPLYGSGLLDGLACATSLAAASVTGILRVASDDHYMTDVLVGAGVGFSSGFLLPMLLHFEQPQKNNRVLVGVIWSGGPFVAATGSM
jgi:membrane-associated phospholipid phosphatase